ncbi:MAG: hypothetical protein ABFD96_25305 [Armatimonadia bacterium]
MSVGKPRKKWLNVERTRHGKAVYYVRKGTSKRIRLPDDYGSKAFWTAYEAAIDHPETSWVRPKILKTDMNRSRIGKSIEVAVNAARTRAKQRGLGFDIDYEWAIAEVERQKLRCAMTGIAFFSREKGSSKCHPYCPSLDRIDNSKGYTKDNVRIVLFAVNAMLRDWGDQVFDHVAANYRTFSSKRRQLARPLLRGAGETA